ncbi:hypothetical protein AB0M54_07345 [Actinoplanes sp. NPDC051470]|uniref:hypothetical protein n=1 Tax=unclassified Actinoplanes TaxID=2626549 RepID=UPI00344738CD
MSFPALAALVLIRLWADPSGRVLSHNDDDHGFFLFVVAHGERVLFHGDNPFFSDRLNVPDGVNIMANTTVLALTLPVAPITHFLGAAVSVVLLLTLGLAGTAAAWYWVFSRHLVTSRLAAWIGALWCGFCPAMVSHANGHINFVSQFVVPFIVWQVIRLREPGRAVRGGVTLGLLIVLQVFINEEVLLFAALTLGVFVIAYALMARSEARAVAGRVAAGVGVAAITSGVLLAYPLWWQFTGKGSYQGQPFTPDEYVTDLLSLGAYARQSLAGNSYVAGVLSVSGTEENTFFGLPLLVLLVIGTRLVWRSVAARSVAIAGLVMLLVSMGPHLRVSGTTTTIPLPFGLISHLPVINLVSVTRFAMVTATVVGVLLALIIDRGVRLTGRSRRWFLIGLAVALVPVLPKPLPTIPAAPLPPFIADGMWRDYVADDRSLVPVPLPEVTTGREAMRWAGLSNLAFRVPRGYFMGPAGPPGNLTGSWNAPHRPTSVLLWKVREYGQVPPLTPEDRSAAVADLTYWRAAVVVLVPGSRNVDALGVTLTDLLGRDPQQVGGVLLWDVRDLPVPPLRSNE